MKKQTKKPERQISPAILKRLVKELGYKEETILALNKGLEEVDSESFLQLLKNDPVFREDMILEHLSRNKKTATRYFSRHDIDIKKLENFPLKKASKKLGAKRK
jgi:replicative superfamily II helicase